MQTTVEITHKLPREQQHALLPIAGTMQLCRLGERRAPFPEEQAPRPVLEQWGFVFLAPTLEEEQRGAVPALLPPGWNCEIKENSDFALILDAEQRARAMFTVPDLRKVTSFIVFPRFSLQVHFAPAITIPEPKPGQPSFERWCYTVVDHVSPERHDGLQGRTVLSSESFPAAQPERPGNASWFAKRQCVWWLNAIWSSWGNPFAYWEPTLAQV